MSILEKGREIVDGERQKMYDSPERNWERIAGMWSAILKTEVSPQHAVLCMVALKVIREAHQHSEDHLVDMAGYLEILDRLT